MRNGNFILGTAAILIASSLVLSVPASADELLIYPAKDQTQEQQAKDQAECQSWAKDQTGFDALAPMPDFTPSAEAAAAVPDAAPAPRGGAVKGAARGAARGAVVGEIANDDAGKGAGVGAAAGAARGMARQRQAGQQQAAQHEAAVQAAMEADVAKQKAAYQGQRDKFDTARKTCLQGRGYTVN